MARERKPKVISAVLELEDNVGAIIAKAKKQINVHLVHGDISAQDLEAKFKQFVDALPIKLEV